MTFGLSVVAFAASCTSSTRSNLRAPQPTSVLVSPNDFLGKVACGGAAGNLIAYQATILDVTENLETPFELPSSELLGCREEAYFEKVVTGHRYIARIQAFDVSGLSPLTPGSTVIVDSEGRAIAPRFTTTCYGENGRDYGLGGAPSDEMGEGGQTALGVKTYDNTRTYVRGCLPLEDASPSGTTKVVVGIDSALSGYTCGDAPGQVATFTIEGVGTDEPAMPPLGGATGMGGAGLGGSGIGGMGGGSSVFVPMEFACGETYEEAVTSTAVRTYHLFGFEKGKETPSFETTCFVEPLLGFTNFATCDPLAQL